MSERCCIFGCQEAATTKLRAADGWWRKVDPFFWFCASHESVYRALGYKLFGVE